MKKVALLFAALYCLQCTTMAQSGRIVFEKKVNAWSLMQLMAQHHAFPMDRFEAYKKQNAEYKTARFILQYDTAHSYFYADSAAAEVNIDEWFAMISAGQVYTDFAQHRQMVRERVFDSSFVVQDRPRGFLWAITPEQKTIAGYDCHKATTLLQDSTSVIAWYTTALPLPAGPEIFQGLPGTILALEIPTLHTSWQAVMVLREEQHITPRWGDAAISYVALCNAVDDMTKEWGGAGMLVRQRALY